MYKDHRGYLIFPIKDNKYIDKTQPILQRLYLFS